MRVEVWCYSKTWGKWIRNIYTNPDDAHKRYERLKRMGKRVKPPQPVNTGLPLYDRVGTFLASAMLRIRGRKRSATRSRDAHAKHLPPAVNSNFHH